MATKDEYIEHTGHYAPVANDGRFDQANPNITENRHNIEADPNEAYSSANITTGSANRFAHDNPNITSNRHNEEHGTEYIIPDTAQQEAIFMTDTKTKKKRRYYALW